MVDPRPIYRFMAQFFYDLEKEMFASEGASGGEKWAPLAPSTVRDKLKHNKPLTILRDTDDLYRSLTRPNAKGSRMVVTRHGLEIGTTLHYGAIHYAGSPKTKLPRRRPVHLTPPQRQEWVKMMQKWIMT